MVFDDKGFVKMVWKNRLWMLSILIVNKDLNGEVNGELYMD